MRCSLVATGLCGLLHLSLLVSLPAYAQVRSDNTLPTPTRVRRQGNRYLVTGGTQAGGNLFHSFEAFSPGDREVLFRDVDSIERLITRVTGGSGSDINGLIQVLQSNGQISPADFFLINPNGVIFGPNARLDVGGSAVVSTAESIQFADGFQFRARNAPSRSLLSVSVPVGLQFGSTPAPIVNESLRLAANFSEERLNAGYYGVFEGLGLSVPPGETIALVGGDLVFPGGEMTVEGGRIELGSVAQAGTVGLRPQGLGWAADYSGIQEFGTMTFSAESDLSVMGDRGGTVRLQAGQILLDESYLSADTLGALPGGRVLVRGDRLTLQQGAQISANTNGSGSAGLIDLQTTGQVELLGADPDDGASSGLFVRVNEGAIGNGGRVLVSAPQLTLRDGGQISIDTFGDGSPGSMQIRADAIDVAGVVIDSQGNPALDRLGLPFPSTLSAVIVGPQSFQPTDAAPNQIEIQTRRLRVSDGATIQTSTFGAADAGNLRIEAIDRVEVWGVSPANPSGLPVPAGIFSQSGGTPGTPYIFAPEATGRGGDLSISTRELVVRDQGLIATGSQNPSPDAPGAGNLTIAARSVTLLDQANILANTNSGAGGNLTLTAQDFLLLRRNSRISTTAGVAGQGGNGGNIALTADFILSVLREDNDITANAFTGNGGRVDVFTSGITGILPQDRLTPRSDITATSDRGNSGTITLTTPPSTDPTQGVVVLPAVPVDASRLIAQNCAAGSAVATDRSAFFLTGRGGLPPGPATLLDREAVTAAWAEVLPDGGRAEGDRATEEAREVEQSADDPSRQQSFPLLEAQGWQQTAAGEVRLVSNAVRLGSLPASSSLPCQTDS